MFDVYINDVSSNSLKIYPVKRPNFPAPEKKYNEYEIPGRGKLYEDTGIYEDITVEIEFNYMGPQDMWHVFFRKCKKFFMNAKTLKLSDDQEFFHIVKKVVIGTNERNSKRIGKFTASFVLDPYFYKETGLIHIDDLDNIYNMYEVSKPIYKIYGEGICHLIVNGCDVTCNVSDNLIIDTNLEISYREDGNKVNTAINQDYKNLFMIEGKNEVKISDGFNLEIIPNWRCL